MKNLRTIFGLCSIAVLAVWIATPPPLPAQGTVEVGKIAPISASAMATPHPAVSQAESEALLQHPSYIGSLVDNNPPSPAGLPLAPGRETQLAESAPEFHGNPADFVVGRNFRNTNANNLTKGSTLAEPAAVGDGPWIVAAGNLRHAEWSANGGQTWNDAPLPGGPPDAPTICCDWDIMLDDARRVYFFSTLYLNGARTNGVVRIFVWSGNNTPTCAYDIDPAGSADNIVPDYPHIGLTKRFLYLTINALGGGGGFARIYRFNIDQMSDCQATSFSSFTQPFNLFGQRVWVPAGGTNNIETMYWGQLDNLTTFRIFSWDESAPGPTSVTRSISTSSFPGSVDCRGGVGNRNWWAPPQGIFPAAGIDGSHLRGVAAPGAAGGPGVLAFYWNAGPDGSHTQGHVHAAVFSLLGFSLVGQPAIFNNGVCIGYPVVTANKRGDIGLSIAAGGQAGGGGSAAQSYVGIDDEFTPGIGFFQSLTLTASGTDNRTDGRFGDYFTIHPAEPCEKWFGATNYALSGGTGVSNVNSRYVEFGRNQSRRCWDSHKNHYPDGL